MAESNPTPSAAGSSDPNTIHIGTRRSALALKQVDLVIAALRAAHPSLTFEVHPLSVQGDRDKETPLAAIGGKGLWTNELEAKLLSHELDLVVHCLKDMPTTLPDGCEIGAVTAREDPRDVVIIKKSLASKCQSLADLPPGSVVGTSALRRSAQLKRRFPALRFIDVRGNIDTRIKKVDDEAGPYSAIILAAAGLKRMGFDDRISEYLDGNKGVLYAVGQGALGLEIQAGNERIKSILETLVDQQTLLATTAERSLMRTLEGGCSVPIGVQTSWQEDGKLRLQATVINIEGTEAVEGDLTQEIGSAEQAEVLGKDMAADLLAKGAGKILDAINAKRDPGTGAVKVSDTT